MKKRINKKKIITLIIILLILIFMLNLIVKQLQKKEMQLEKERAKEGETYMYYEGKTFPSGIYKLKYLYTQMGGTLEQELYYEQLYSFCNYIPKLYKTVQDKNSKELKEYYNKNEFYIKLNTGIAEEQAFLDIAYKLQEISTSDNNLGDYKNSSIDNNNLYVEDNSCVFDTTIYYNNFEEGLTFKTYFNISDKTTEFCNNVYFKY